MSLSYFTIFNPSLGPDEESLPYQILFYTSASTSDLDSQLRNIGLVQGIIELGRSFSRQDAEPIDFIKSRDTRSYLLELEPGFWSILCLDAFSENGTKTQLLPTTGQVLGQVRNAYDHFTLEHNDFSFLLETSGREKSIKIIETWWMRWFWSWTPEGVDATLAFDGYLQKRAYMSDSNGQQLATWYDQLHHEFKLILEGVAILHLDEYIWTSGRRFVSSMTKRRIQRYATEYLNSTHSTRGDANSSPEQSSAIPEDSATLINSMESWLNPKKWSLDTDQMINLFKKPAKPDISTTDIPSPVGHLIFQEAKELYLGAYQGDDNATIFLNIFQFGDMELLILLSSKDADQWHRIAQSLNDTFPALYQSVSPPPKSPRIPYFFSLLHDSNSGAIYSTIPALLPALVQNESDTVAQVQVKQNTIHLHRQLYVLKDQKSREVVVKTGKGIWIMMKTDEMGSVVLCKSSRSGETMEEIEREGRRWIGKLRAVHLGLKDESKDRSTA